MRSAVTHTRNISRFSTNRRVFCEIYISGKITGDRRYKAKFREVEKKLAAAGHIVLNPATAPEGLRPVDYMRLCFAMMEAADVVLFMQDYQDSRGAMLEWAWCQYVGKQTCFDLAAFGGAKTE